MGSTIRVLPLWKQMYVSWIGSGCHWVGQIPLSNSCWLPSPGKRPGASGEYPETLYYFVILIYFFVERGIQTVVAGSGRVLYVLKPKTHYYNAFTCRWTNCNRRLQRSRTSEVDFTYFFKAWIEPGITVFSTWIVPLKSIKTPLTLLLLPAILFPNANRWLFGSRTSLGPSVPAKLSWGKGRPYLCRSSLNSPLGAEVCSVTTLREPETTALNRKAGWAS